jgi:hypothetical protein
MIDNAIRPLTMGMTVTVDIKDRLAASGRTSSLKRPPKTPDRVYPMVKNQEYDRVYDWEHRSG